MEKSLKISFTSYISFVDNSQLHFLIFLFVGYLIPGREEMMNFCWMNFWWSFLFAIFEKWWSKHFLSEIKVSLAHVAQSDKFMFWIIRKKVTNTELRENKKFKVFVAESAPLYSGRVQAEKLIENGIDVTVINDDDIYSVMTEFNKMKVLIGARAILVNGAAITYNGAYNICLSANMFFIPVIIAGGVTKLTPMYSFNHELYN